MGPPHSKVASCHQSKWTTFTKYFSDKKRGDGKKPFAAAEAALAGLKALLEGAKLVNGKSLKDYPVEWRHRC